MIHYLFHISKVSISSIIIVSNQPPIANAYRFTLQFDSRPVVIPASGMLANDTDPEAVDLAVNVGRVTQNRIAVRFSVDVPLPPSRATNQSYPDKAQRRAEIIAPRAEGLSYHAIGEALGLPWTQMGQLLKADDVAL
jgi:hypothetical protein